MKRKRKKKRSAWVNIKGEVLRALAQKNKLKYQLGQYENLQWTQKNSTKNFIQAGKSHFDFWLCSKLSFFHSQFHKILFHNKNQNHVLKISVIHFKCFTSSQFWLKHLPSSTQIHYQVLSFAKSGFELIPCRHGWINSEVLSLIQKYCQLENLSEVVSVISKPTIIIRKHTRICQRFLIFVLTSMRFWRPFGPESEELRYKNV